MCSMVQLELHLSKIFSEHIYYKTIVIDNCARNPDEVVLDFLKSQNLINFANYLIHSTSWRYEEGNIIKLTYLVVLPTEESYELTKQLDLMNTKIAHAESSYKPRPSFIDETSVIRHAFRHLAYLLKHDYTNQYAHLFTLAQKLYIASVYDEIAG